jgi:arylsulfatase A-like enzyme
MYDPGYEGEVIPHANYGRDDYMTPAEQRHVKALYAGEVSLVDTWVGYLLDQIDRLGYRDNTAFVHLSDHGHYFAEHGLQGKPQTEHLALYEGVTRMACALRLPDGLGRGARLPAIVQPPDIPATLLDLAGIDPWEGMEGGSLLPLLDGRATRVREAGFVSRYPFQQHINRPREITPCQIVTEEWTYQYWPGSPESEELFHVSRDPGQTRNVLDQERALAAELRARYLGWLRERQPDMAEWLVRAEHDRDFWPPDDRLWHRVW